MDSPAMQKTQEKPKVRSWKTPWKEGMVTHSSILALENPTERRAWRAIVYQAACNQTQRKQLSMRAHRLQEKQVSYDVT